MTSSQTPAARRRAQWQERESGFRSLSMPVRSLLLPKTEASLRERTPWARSRPPSTTFRVQSESEPSWVAMSSAMSSSPANAGSGAYPRGGETRHNKRHRQRARSGRPSASGARENFDLGYEASRRRWPRLRGMAVLTRGGLENRLIGNCLSTLEGQPRAHCLWAVAEKA